MRIVNIEQNTEEWLESRKRKITGSKLKNVVVLRGLKRKIGTFQLVADAIGKQPEEFEDARERGHRLEQEAVELLEKVTKVKFKQVGMIISDISDDIALSPDAVEDADVITIAGEIKCLDNKNHLEAILDIPDIGNEDADIELTKTIPKDFKFQILQYFIVIETLQKLFLGFYNPDVGALSFHYIEVTREELKDDIEYYRDYQLKELALVKRIIEKVAF
jgi:hypothetical protein